MMKKPNCPIIAIEEHYWDPELAKHFTGPEAGRGNETDERLYDLGSLRLKEMDEAGHRHPGAVARRAFHPEARRPISPPN